MAGYSGKSLFEKLNLRADHQVAFFDPPTTLASELAPLHRAPAALADDGDATIDAALIFARDLAILDDALARALPQMAPGAMIWLAWPKRKSGIAANLGESDVRRIGLATGWVDVKVCAIDDQWSGLKFLRRRK